MYIFIFCDKEIIKHKSLTYILQYAKKFIEEMTFVKMDKHNEKEIKNEIAIVDGDCCYALRCTIDVFLLLTKLSEIETKMCILTEK